MSKKSTANDAPSPLIPALGLGIAIAVVVGNVIGSGIFLKPGTIAAASGNFGLIIGVWVAGGTLCILGGLCFAELAAMFPKAGGLYVYTREAYGRPVGFLYGWNEVLFGKPASLGALAVAFIGALGSALKWQPHAFVEVGIAIAMIVVMAIVNILGVIWGGRLQLVFTLIKAGFLALVAVAPFALMPFVEHSVELANYSSRIEPEYPELAKQIGIVLLAVMWAYNGWHGVTPLAEEIRNPQRNIPLALLGGIGILIVLYVAANFAYHGVLSMPEMAAQREHAAEAMLGKLLGSGGVAAMSAVIMCSTFGAINTNLLQAPRITYAMGRDGVFFRSLGQVHATFRTPAAAIGLMAAMAILLILTVAVAKQVVQKPPAATPANGTANTLEKVAEEPVPTSLGPRIVHSLRNDSIFDLLTNFVIFSSSIFYTLAVLAVIVLRIRQPDRPRPYRTFGYPVVPLLFVVVYVWFLSQVYTTNPLESRTGLFIIGLGIVAYFAYNRVAGGGKPQPSTDTGEPQNG